MNKNICVITGTRADYGILLSTMREIKAAKSLNLQIVATGMHLNSKFGNTYKIIEEDGFVINRKVDLGEMEDSRLSVVRQVSQGLLGFADAYLELRPDLIIILGDRYEMLAAAQSALFLNIPIAHIHGGEVTEGAFDDSIRHSITKMSHLHFTAAEDYRQRVIQMGASSSKVFNVGAPGLDNFNRLKLLSRTELEADLNFKFRQKNILVTYHPVTAIEENGISQLLLALAELQDVGQIITMPNSDPGHQEIFEKLRSYAQNRPNVFLTTSLGQIRYLSTMKLCDAIVGNSSSGILEAPFSGTPTVNIGERQKGRILAESVYQLDDIQEEAIKNIISMAIEKPKNPSFIFGDGNASFKIVEIIQNYFLD